MADGSVPAKPRAENTARAYRSSWRGFAAWCAAKSIAPSTATPETVAEYLESRLDEGLHVTSVARIYTGIAAGLRKAQPNGPWVARARPEIIQKLIDDAWTTYEPNPQTKRLLPEHVAALAARFDRSRWFESARNRTILVFGFAVGLRRGELVGLDVEDLRFWPNCVEVRVGSTKDPIVVWRQYGLCPVATLEWYLREARIRSGPVFRALYKGRLTNRRLCDRAVALIVKDAVASIGLDPSEYSGDSLWCGPNKNV